VTQVDMTQVDMGGGAQAAQPQISMHHTFESGSQVEYTRVSGVWTCSALKYGR